MKCTLSLDVWTVTLKTCISYLFAGSVPVSGSSQILNLYIIHHIENGVQIFVKFLIKLLCKNEQNLKSCKLTCSALEITIGT